MKTYAFYVVLANGQREYFTELEMRKANALAQDVANETGKPAYRHDSGGQGRSTFYPQPAKRGKAVKKNPATRGGGAVPRCTCGGKVERFGKMTHCGHARTCPVYAKSLADGLETGHSGKRNPEKAAKTGRAGNPIAKPMGTWPMPYEVDSGITVATAELYLRNPSATASQLQTSATAAITKLYGRNAHLDKSEEAKFRRIFDNTYAGWSKKSARDYVASYTKRTGKRNPEGDDSDAADMYETFHGKPSTGVVDYEEDYYEPDAYAELGDLIELWVIPVHSTSDKAQKIESANPDTASASDVVKLACSPDGTQLYFIGGDQAIDLSALGFESKETRQHMMLGVLCELTYRAKKGFHKFKLTDYFHRLGEESGNEPFLCYDPHSQKLTVVGGSYKVRDIGIVD